jgi:hypothetical protein
MKQQADNSADTTPQPIPLGWSIHCYTLLIEERQCENCKTIHTAPAPSIRVGLIQNKTKATRTISLPDLHLFYSQLPKTVREEFDSPILPRSIRRISTEVSFCQSCFTTVESGQLDLFEPELQLLSPTAVANYQAGREALAQEFGRVPTTAEIKKYKKPPPKAKSPKGTFNIKDFL